MLRSLQRVSIVDEKGANVATLQGTLTPGINRVWWDLRSTAPAKTTSENGRGSGSAESSQEGGGRGVASPLVAPGTYTVKLSVDGEELASKLMVRKDPLAPAN